MKLNRSNRLTQISHILPAIICFLFSLWGLYLRFLSSYGRSFWNDESYHLRVTAKAFKPFWLRTYYGDFSCFPGDYLLTYPFIKFFLIGKDLSNEYLVFNAHKWGLLIPHMLATVLGFFILFVICRRYFKTLWGYIITFILVCFHPTLIYHSFEFRTYAFLPTLALASFALMDVLFLNYEQMSRWKKALMAFFFLFVSIFHAFAILFLFLPACYFLTWEWKNNHKHLWKKPVAIFLFVVFAVACFLWLWYMGLGPFVGHKLFVSPKNVFYFLPDPHKNLNEFLYTLIVTIFLGQKHLTFLFGGILLYLIVPNKNKIKQSVFFFIFVVVAVVLVFLAVYINKYWFLPRQFLWTIPFFAFYMGWCWDSLMDRLALNKIISNNYLRILVIVLKISAMAGICFFLFYKAKPLFKISLKDYAQNAKKDLLNKSMPQSFDYLIKLDEKTELPVRYKLQEFASYYENVTLFAPSADAFGLLGYCYHYLGFQEKSMEAYRKAIQMKPNFFWFYYNLGILSYKNGSYQNAALLFQKALETKTKDNINLVFSSRIYYPLLSAEGINYSKLQQRLVDGRRKSYELVILSYLHLQNYTDILYLATQILESSFKEKDAFYYYAALSSFLLDEHKQAIFFLQEYLKRLPDNPKAQHLLKEILTNKDKKKEDFLKNFLKVKDGEMELKLKFF